MSEPCDCSMLLYRPLPPPDGRSKSLINFLISACRAPTEAATETPAALPAQPTVSPLAGHTVNEWGDKLVIVGGHVKVGVRCCLFPSLSLCVCLLSLCVCVSVSVFTLPFLPQLLALQSKDASVPLPVRIYHTDCNAWEVVQPSGTSPPPRGGHTVSICFYFLFVSALINLLPLELRHILAKICEHGFQMKARSKLCRPHLSAPSKHQHCHTHSQSSLVGNKLYIFGGEDGARRALGDLHILDLPSMTWERTVPIAAGAPAQPQVRQGGGDVKLWLEMF